MSERASCSRRVTTAPASQGAARAEKTLSPITVVFHNKIWIYSGKHTGSDDNWGGDVWQMTTGDVIAR